MLDFVGDLRVVINCLIIPLVSLYILYRDKEMPGGQGAKVLFQYALAVVSNLILSKAAVLFISYMFNVRYYEYSIVYTGIAFAAAVILGFLAERGAGLLRLVLMDEKKEDGERADE